MKKHKDFRGYFDLPALNVYAFKHKSMNVSY